MEITPDEANRLRQWFNSLQDTNPKFLEPADFALYEKIVRRIKLSGGRLKLVRVYDESEVEEVAVGEYQSKKRRVGK